MRPWLAGVALLVTLQAQPTEVDLLIRGGRIVDGTGNPWVRADLAIRGDTIVAVGRTPVSARRTIEATGKIVAPGFIDMHAHSEYGLMVDGRGLSKATQGVTTEVVGEHMSAGPVMGHAEEESWVVAPPIRRDWQTLGQFFDRLRRTGIGLNLVSYVGAGQVRACVIGYENRPARPDEMEQMKALLSQAMEEGAFGLSTGLAYFPNAYMSTAELIELAKVAARHGGIYVSHLRGGIEGLREGIRIAREAGVPLEIHHVNSSFSRTVKEFVAEVEQARRDGVDVTGNAYPYSGGWTYLKGLLPDWVQEGGTEAMLRRLRDPGQRAKVVAELRQGAERQAGRWDRVFISAADPNVDGLSVSDVGKKRNKGPEEALVEVLIEQKGQGMQIGRGEAGEALAQILRQPWIEIGSDGAAHRVGLKTPMGKPHPRSFGTHPRVLGKYVREEKLFTLEEGVRKMTGLPASRLGLMDRGLLRPGFKADVVIFDPNTVQDVATFEQPEQYSTGIDWVFVNGEAVVENGKPTDKLPGRVLEGPGLKRPRATDAR